MSTKPKRARRFWKKKHYRKKKNTPEENSSNLEQSLEKSKREIHLEISCIEVSSRLYWDYKARFLLSGIPVCLTENVCKHHLNGTERSVKQIPEKVESSFKMDYNTNAWYEALEMVQMSINPHQYISPDVLHAIIEIMLNTQENVCEDYPGIHIVSICQQLLAKNFSYHPPCQDKNVRDCYIKFLTTPMGLKDQEYTNKIQFEYQKGVVKYCLNRLEHEMSTHSVDGPLMNKEKNDQQNLKNEMKKCDNFEFLNRPERIKRLIAVLESIIELLQTDLAICHSKYTYNLGTHILKSEKPLMTFILWPGNIRYCGTVNKNCTQIMRIFVYLCHLEYPSYMLDVVANWLNTMIQTFYLCETNATSDYPHIDKFCNHLANEFYKIITKVSVESIERILVRIQPPFMKYHIAMIHIKSTFPVRDDCILKILIRFMRQQQWLRYHDTNEPFKLMPGFHVLKHLFVRLINKNLDWIYGDAEEELTTYSKLGEKTLQVGPAGPSTATAAARSSNIPLQHAVHILYLTLEAFLESYNLYGVQKLWCIWNSSILDGNELLRRLKEKTNYSLTEDFIRKYDDNLSALQELQNVYYGTVGKENVPEIMRVFAKLLPLYELEDT